LVLRVCFLVAKLLNLLVNRQDLSLFLLLAIGEQATQKVVGLFFLFGIGTEMNRYGGMDMGMDGRMGYGHGMELELVRTGMTGLVAW